MSSWSPIFMTCAITRSGMVTDSSGVFHQMYLLANCVEALRSIWPMALLSPSLACGETMRDGRMGSLRLAVKQESAVTRSFSPTRAVDQRVNNGRS